MDRALGRFPEQDPAQVETEERPDSTREHLFHVGLLGPTVQFTTFSVESVYGSDTDSLEKASLCSLVLKKQFRYTVLKREERYMSTRANYFAFAEAHPEQFVNPLEGGFTILMNEAEIREAEATVAQKLQTKGLPTEWAQVGIVYQDQYGMILRDAVRFPGGALGTYIRFISGADGAPTTIILPLYQSQVLLVRRFRHATRTWHLELPRGFGTRGLSAEDNARGELVKEIGARVSRLVSLGPLGPNLESAELFSAEIASYGEPNAHEGIIEVVPVTVPELERLIRESQITEAFTIMACTHAQLQGLLQVGKQVPRVIEPGEWK